MLRAAAAYDRRLRAAAASAARVLSGPTPHLVTARTSKNPYWDRLSSISSLSIRLVLGTVGSDLHSGIDRIEMGPLSHIFSRSVLSIVRIERMENCQKNSSHSILFSTPHRPTGH